MAVIMASGGAGSGALRGLLVSLACLVCLSSGFRFLVAEGKGGLAVAVAVELPTRNLMELTQRIKQMQRPQLELVFDAYEDYVKLHRIQSGQAGSYGDKLLAANKNEDETRARIGQILNEPFVRTISGSLFALMPDSNVDGKLERSRQLARRLTRAMANLGLA